MIEYIVLEFFYKIYGLSTGIFDAFIAEIIQIVLQLPLCNTVYTKYFDELQFIHEICENILPPKSPTM